MQKDFTAIPDAFTYEEKYTWLAVHYLQGYLSYHVPREVSHKKRSYVTDYGLI